MLHDSFSTLQLTLRVVTNVLLGVGATSLVGAGYLALFRPRRPRPGPGPAALAGLAILSLVMGAGLYAAIYRFATPRHPPIADPIDTKEHYRGTLPAIDLIAPPGWSLRRTPSPDKLSFQVQAVQDAPPVTMIVETMNIDDFTSPDKTLGAMAEALAKVGITVEAERASDTVAGKPARGLLGQRADGLRLVIWIVPLGGSVVGSVQCFCPTEMAPRTACAAAMKNLRWVLP